MISREVWKLEVDGLDIVLGIWMFVMPFILGPGLPNLTLGVLVALGLIAAADATWAIAKPAMRSPEWLMGLVGLALFVSPWALDFNSVLPIAWNAWIIGAIFAIDSVLGYVARVRGASAAGPTHQPAH